MAPQKIPLLEWLNLDCLEEDLDSLSWKPGIKYHSTDRTREKIEYLKSEYGVVITQTDFQFDCTPTYNKDNLVTGIVKYTLQHKDFPQGFVKIVGMASFFMGQYTGGYSFAQIADSLATVRGFSKEWKQFGKGINKTEDPNKEMKAPSVNGVKETSDKVKNTLKVLT